MLYSKFPILKHVATLHCDICNTESYKVMMSSFSFRSLTHSTEQTKSVRHYHSIFRWCMPDFPVPSITIKSTHLTVCF